MLRSRLRLTSSKLSSCGLACAEISSRQVPRKFAEKIFASANRVCLCQLKVVVVNNEELSPQDELVQDIAAILHVFSCRLYGLRKYKKQIEGDEEIAKELQNGNKSDSRAKNQD